MEPYQDCGMVGSLHLWSCLRCGALTVSKAQHNEWHDEATGPTVASPVDGGTVRDARRDRGRVGVAEPISKRGLPILTPEAVIRLSGMALDAHHQCVSGEAMIDERYWRTVLWLQEESLRDRTLSDRLAREVAMAAVEWLASDGDDDRFARLDAKVAKWKEAVLEP